MSGIFISYRREDSEDSTRAIYESLVPKFGKERLFLDVEAIKPGSDFRDAIEESLGSCGVFLAVIGPTWLNVRANNDPTGPRRLDHPGDYVRQEVAAALRKGHTLPVIPVLVRGASMPTVEELPEELKDLAYRNGLNMNNLDWDGDMAKLVDAMRAHVGEPRSSDATASVTAPKSVAPSASTALSRRRKWIFLGIAASVLVAFLVLYNGTKDSTGGIAGGNTHDPDDSIGGTARGNSSDTEYSVTLVKNPRLAGLQGPIEVEIDNKLEGAIWPKSDGSLPLEFRVTAGEHRFKFTNTDTNTECTGTFSVNPQQTKFIPRIRNGGTTCALDVALGGS